jgi:hypothetical protein
VPGGCDPEGVTPEVKSLAHTAKDAITLGRMISQKLAL